MIHSQVFQTGVDHTLDMLLSGNTALDFLLGAGQELGGDHHFIPLGKIPQGPAYILLAGAALISYGCIEEVDSQLQTVPDNFTGMLLI